MNNDIETIFCNTYESLSINKDSCKIYIVLMHSYKMSPLTTVSKFNLKFVYTIIMNLSINKSS